MIRAEVLVQSRAAQDWRIDRGVITAVAGTYVTLREADGTTRDVDIAPTARVQGAGRGLDRRRSCASGSASSSTTRRTLPADLVQVEGVGS